MRAILVIVTDLPIWITCRNDQEFFAVLEALNGRV